MDIYTNIENYYKIKPNPDIPIMNPKKDSILDLNDVIGKEYEDFWWSRERYRVL